jgi:hypothetical protein
LFESDRLKTSAANSNVSAIGVDGMTALLQPSTRQTDLGR